MKVKNLFQVIHPCALPAGTYWFTDGHGTAFFRGVSLWQPTPFISQGVYIASVCFWNLEGKAWHEESIVAALTAILEEK